MGAINEQGLDSDVSSDIAVGDDWLSASLDEEPSSELKPTSTQSTAAAVPRSSTRSSSMTLGEPEDDSASWERSVIGDDDQHSSADVNLDDPRSARDASAPAQRASDSRSSAPTSRPTGKATQAGPPVDKASGRPAAKGPSRSETKKAPGSSRGDDLRAPAVNDKPTRSERRKLRRADKRLAEREARALMNRRPLWRGRVLPKTVLGISFTMLVSGLAMAASGTLLYMNYRYRQDQSDALVRNFPQQVRQAQRAVQNEGRNARSLIQDELEPLRKLAATAETLTSVLNGAEPSVWSVRTFDVDGQGTAGTAFVVASDDEKTFMITSLAVVKASTARPGPQILVRKGSTESVATLWTWDDKSDMALLVVSGLGDQPPLSWAAPTSTRLGDQVFIASGFGANDASIVEGRIGDVSADGVQHTAPIGTHFRGGPIIDAQGRVVAVASWDYAPLGFRSEGVFFAPPISASCETILRCLNNRVDGAGAQR